jgi:hypothetical protein
MNVEKQIYGPYSLADGESLLIIVKSEYCDAKRFSEVDFDSLLHARCHPECENEIAPS